MSYRVRLFNRYAKGDELTLEFDTESVMMEDVVMDADIEALTHRMHNQQNYNQRPVFQKIWAYPTMSFRK